VRSYCSLAGIGLPQLFCSNNSLLNIFGVLLIKY